MEICKNFPYAKVKIEDDADCVIDLEAEPTYTDNIEAWCNDMTQTINKTVQLDSLYEKFIDDLMATYYTSLNHKTINNRDKFLLRDKILSHIKCFYLYYKDIEHSLVNTNYFIRMEDILTYYCSLELELVYRLSKQREIKRHSLFVVKRLSKALGMYLHYKLKHIMHVLLRITFNVRNATCQILMKKLYIHFLMSMPTEPFSDEAFCRYYLLFERCKDVAKPEEKEKLSKFVYMKFDKTKDFLNTNPLMKSVLTPPVDITNIVDQMFNFRNAQITAYFQYLKNSQAEEMSRLSTNIDAHCGSNDFSKTYNDLLCTFSETSINIVNMEPLSVDSDSDVIAVDEDGTVVLSDDDDIAEIIYKQKYIKSKHKTKTKFTFPVSDSSVINLDSDDEPESSVDKTLMLCNSVEKNPSTSLDVTLPTSSAVISTVVTTLASPIYVTNISTLTNVASTPLSPVRELLVTPEEIETIVSNTIASSVNTTSSAPTVQQLNVLQPSPPSVSSSLPQSIPSTSTESIQFGQSSEMSNLFSQSVSKLLADETEKESKEYAIDTKINDSSEEKEKECEGIAITSSMSFLSRQFSPIQTPSLFSSPVQTPSLFDTMNDSQSSLPNLDLSQQTTEINQPGAETTSLVQGTLLLISKLHINEEVKYPTVQTPSTEAAANMFFSKKFEDDKQSDSAQMLTSFPVEMQTSFPVEMQNSFPVEMQTTNELSSEVHKLPSVLSLETTQSECSSYSPPITSTHTTQSLNRKISTLISSTIPQDFPENTTEEVMVSSCNQSDLILPSPTDSSTACASKETIQTASSLQQISDQRILPPIEDISLEKEKDVSTQLKETSKISHEDTNLKSMVSFPLDNSLNSPTTFLSQQICQNTLPSPQLSLQKISELVQDSRSTIDTLALIKDSAKTSIQPLLHSLENTYFEQRSSPNPNLNVQLSVESFLPSISSVPIVSSVQTSTEVESLPLISGSQSSLSHTMFSTSSIHLTTETSSIISKETLHSVISSDNNTLEPIVSPKMQLADKYNSITISSTEHTSATLPSLRTESSYGTIFSTENTTPAETLSSDSIIPENTSSSTSYNSSSGKYNFSECFSFDCNLCSYKRNKKRKATKKRKSSKAVSQNFGVITPPSDENLPDDENFDESIYNSHPEFFKKHLPTDTTCLKNIVIQKVETVSSKDISISYNQNEVNNIMKYNSPEQDDYCDTGQFFLKNSNTDQNLEIEETVVQAIPPTTSSYNCECVNNKIQKTSILKSVFKNRNSKYKELNELRNNKSPKQNAKNDEDNKGQKILYTSEVINPKVDDFSNLKNVYSNLVGTSENNELDRILSGPISSMNGFNTSNSQYYENSDSNFNLFGYANSVPPLFGDISKNLITKEIDSPAYNEMDSDDFRDYIENEFRYKSVLAPAELSKSTNSDGGHASGKCGVVFNDVVDTRFIAPTYIKPKKSHYCDSKKLRVVIRNRIKCFIDPYDEKLNMTTKVVLNKISDNDLLNKYKVTNHNTLRSCIRKKIDCSPTTTTKSDFQSKGFHIDEPPEQQEITAQIRAHVEDPQVFNNNENYFILSSELEDEKIEVDVVGTTENHNFLDEAYHKDKLQNDFFLSSGNINEINRSNYIPDLYKYLLNGEDENKSNIVFGNEPFYLNKDGSIFEGNAECNAVNNILTIDETASFSVKDSNAINYSNSTLHGTTQPNGNQSSKITERAVEKFNTHSSVQFLNDCSKQYERSTINEGVTTQTSQKRTSECLHSVKTPNDIKPETNKVSTDLSDQCSVKDTINHCFAGTGSSMDDNEIDISSFYGELSDAELSHLIESLNSGSETRLPFKKRRVSVNVKHEMKYNPSKEEISYPATPMISIAEIEALQNKATNIRSFKTPAERKEMPPLPIYYNVNSEPSPIITDQFNINNHTYNNPTINYHMSNMPMPFIPCASYFPISPIILPFNNLSSFEQTNAANVNCNKTTGLPQPFKPVKKEKSKKKTSYSASCCYN